MTASIPKDGTTAQARLQPSTAFQAQEILWEVRGQIFSILRWAFWAELWLASLAGLALATLFLRYLLDFLLLDLIGGGLIVGFLGGIFAILPAWRAKNALEDWEEEMLPFIYSVKFELLPAKDGDRLLDIWDRYKVIYRSLSSIDVPRTGSRFYDAETLKYRSMVKGKKARHEFDIYARIASDFVLLVRRYTDPSPVSLTSIQTLKSDAEDVVKRANPSDFVVGAFSASGFAPEAIAFCQSDAGKVDEDVPIDLIGETAQGYSIVSVVID